MAEQTGPHGLDPTVPRQQERSVNRGRSDGPAAGAAAATATQRRPDPPTQRLPSPPAPRPPRERGDDSGPRRQRRTVTVRRVDPWTVLKLSVVFYFVFLLFFMLALTLLWTFVEQTGMIDDLLDFLREASVNIEVREGAIGRALFLLGLLGVVAGTGANVFFCFLYNLVADIAGGLRVTLEDDS
jgi:hypothetical protein